MVFDMNYWSKVTRKLLILIFTIIGIYLGFKLAVFYLPFLIAFLLSLLIEPSIRFLMKKIKLKRKTSAILVFAIVISIITGLVAWGVATLIQEASNMLNGLNGYFEKAYLQVQNINSYFEISKIQISDEVKQVIQNSTGDFLAEISVLVKNALTKILNTITSLPTIGFYVVICVLSLYFICTDKIYMLDQLEHHLPETWVKKLAKHIRELARALGCFLKAESILIIVSFVISLIGLYIFKIVGLNVQYPLMAALGIGFVDALPIFGSGTVMLPWALITACNGDYRLAISIFVLWVFMSIVRQVIEPKVVSGQIGIHPIFTLIAMYTGFRFIGVIGMLIGPVVLIVLKDIFSTLIDKGVMKAIFDRE